MMKVKVEKREMRANAHCRICYRVPKNKEDHFISFYSSMNRGQNIHLCPGCVDKLYEINHAEESQPVVEGQDEAVHQS